MRHDVLDKKTCVKLVIQPYENPNNRLIIIEPWHLVVLKGKHDTTMFDGMHTAWRAMRYFIMDGSV